MTNKQIRDLIENQKELLIQNAVNQAAQDLMNQMLDAEVNKMRAAEAMQAAADATKEACLLYTSQFMILLGWVLLSAWKEKSTIYSTPSSVPDRGT